MRLALSSGILRRCWFLGGPTASGKTAVSMALAERLGAEIVSMDSMALYRGMDIGTAKPDRNARARVAHHLIDVLEPHEEFSLAQYMRAAELACRDILSRGRIPLFVGGTGLYLRSVLRGIFEGPPADWERRKEFSRVAESSGPGALHNWLKQIDPVSAARLHPNDVRRVSRAIEVHELSGRPLSEWQQERPLPPDQRPRHVYWLSPDREWLSHRIRQRIQQMLAEGLLEEVRRLLLGRPLSRTARQAVGYKELVDHLEGRLTYEEASREIEEHTRLFAKRQFTWFRNLEECTAVPIQEESTPERIADLLLEMCRSG